MLTFTLQKIAPAELATRGHKSAASFATGPVIALPFISPFGLTMTPALSSKYMNIPSRRLNAFRCRTMIAGVTVKNQMMKNTEVVSKFVISCCMLLNFTTKTYFSFLILAFLS